MVKATGVPVREGEPRLAVNVIEDVTEVKRAELAQRFLAEASAVLASALDYEQTLAQVAELAVPRLADWCAVTMPDRATGCAPSRWPTSIRPRSRSRARYQERYPTAADAPTGAAQVLRDGVLAADQRDHGRAARARRCRIRSSAAALADARACAPRWSCRWSPAGRTIGVISFVSAESGRALHPGRPRARRGARPPRGHRGRERAAVPRALAHRRHAAARPAARRAAGDPRAAARLAVPPGGRGEPRRRRLLRRVPDRRRAGCCWSATSPGRGAEAAALTGQARHTLRTAGTLLGDPDGRRRAAQPRARPARRADAVHGRARAPRTGRADRARALRGPSAAAARARRGGRARSGTSARCSGAWPDSHWRAERVDAAARRRARALQRRRDRHRGRGRALRRGRGCSRRCAACATPTGAVAAIDAALNDFQRGAQADDTAVLALDLP